MRFVLLLLISSILLSCKKYEEGPLVSLKSKTERVSNTWRIEKATQHGKDITSTYEGWRITFTKEGYYFYFLTGSKNYGLTDFKGQWVFDERKEKIIVKYINEDKEEIILELKIQKLKENEMYLEYNEQSISYHLVSS